jgi:hypothetical protein
MARIVFVSHAGADWPRVQAVADRLRQGAIEPLVDPEELDLGDSFLAFMERSLRRAHYCLLLWSAAAARSPWVQVEWEAAFHRTISESQRFLVVGRLDDHPVPELLRPRLQVRLFPDLQAGVDEVIELCRRDEQAESEGMRPVFALRADDTPAAGGVPVYISSELFGRTFPWRVDPAWPAALLVERLVAALGLPTTLEHEGRVGCRLRYGLALGERALVPEQPLSPQGVKAHDLLWLTTAVEPFAAATPLAGSLSGATFRDSGELAQAVQRALRQRAQAVGMA